MPDSRRRSVFISVPTARSKLILDSRIFAALRARFNVHVFGGLSDGPGIERAYGGARVFWHPEVRVASWSGRMVLRFLEAARSLGFKYRKRREPGMKIRWDLTIGYRQIMPAVRRGRFRRLVLSALAWATARRLVWRLVRRSADPWVADRGLERLIASERPTAMIVSGYPSPQEIAFALVARRMGIRCIMVPVSPDDAFDRGYLMAEYDAIAAWGPAMRRNLERLHEVDPARIANLGVLTTRLQSEILSSDAGFDTRASLGIPERARIVTYLSVVNYETSETFAAVDALASAVRSGELPDTVIVLRTSPWEDATEARARYGGNPHVRVQDSGARPLGAAGTEALAEHASMLRASTVLIMGSFTSSVFQAAVWGVPTILNRAERKGPPELIAPFAHEEDDPSGTISAGLPLAWSLGELLRLTKAYLANPGMHDDVWDRIGRDWDYQDDDYVEHFLRLLD